jgi:MYXO-CTERM domain-containing protein
MRLRVLAVTALIVSLEAPVLAAPPVVAAVRDTQKIRPNDPPPPAKTSMALSCAQNEFCAFQVAVSANGAAEVIADIAVSDLAGPGGHTLAGSSALVYREAFIDVTTRSNMMGATGAWPDALIPKVDEFFGETRNAFPANIAAGQTQAFWIELHVPDGQAPGMYTGKVTVTDPKNGATDVMLSIHVRGFSLPSTSSLASAYGFDWDGPCIGHFGGYGPPNCDDAGLEAINALYFQDALNHRITISELVYAPPVTNGKGDFGSFDTLYGPFLDGTALTGPNQLKGAKITTLKYTGDQVAASYAAWATHFKPKGWFDRVFDYTCDEPPNGCAWTDIPARAAIVHQGDPLFRTLTTTSVQEATKNGVLASLDILVPIVNEMDGTMNDPFPGNQRTNYDAFLMRPNTELWMYQSCEPSSSCSNGQVQGTPGFPTMFIDESALSNRLMQWFDFEFQVGAELYYDTTYAMASQDAWTSQYEFGNNGDGSIWYPGKPSVIGGTKDIPIESLRMKMLRAGMQDYEYLALLTKLGGGSFANQQLGMVTQGTSYNPDPSVLDGARLAMADEIEKLLATGVDGGTTASASSTTTTGLGAGGGAVSSGAAGTGATNGSGGASGDTRGGSKKAGCSCETGSASSPGGILALALALAGALTRRRGPARPTATLR